MKKAGIIFLILGILGALFALTMDTTVPSGTSRVHNVGLMNEQENLLRTFLLLTLIGAGTLMANSLKSSKAKSKRTCPFCAEIIQIDASYCKHCHREVEPAVSAATESPSSILLINKVETGLEFLLDKALEMSTLAVDQARPLTPIWQKVRKPLAHYLLALGLVAFCFFAFIFDYSVYTKGYEDLGINTLRIQLSNIKDALIIVLLGLIVGYPRLFIKSTKTEPCCGHGQKLATTISLQGIHVNLIIAQLALLIAIFYLRNQFRVTDFDFEIAISYLLALLVVGISYVLIKSNQRYLTFVTGAISLGYLLLGHVDFSPEQKSLLDGLIRDFPAPPLIETQPYVLLFLFNLALPVVKLIKIGPYKIGNIWGDVQPKIGGHNIFLAFGSTLLVLTLFYGAYEAYYMPRMLWVYYFWGD